MSANWMAVAARLLECVSEPALVVDADERIVLNNAAMERLLDRSELAGQRWSETLSAKPFQALGRAIEQRLSQAEVEVQADGERRLHLVLAIVPIADEPLAIARVVHHQSVEDPASSSRAHLRYEIEWQEPNRYRLRVVDGPQRASVGETCHAALQGRTSPCVGCPTLQLGLGPLRSGVVLSAEGREPIRLVQASRTEGGSLTMDAWEVDDGALWRLLEAKVTLLAQRADLSDRERDVLLWLMRGRSAEDLGTILGITPRTVKFHQANVLRKLGAESRTDLLALIF